MTMRDMNGREIKVTDLVEYDPPIGGVDLYRVVTWVDGDKLMYETVTQEGEVLRDWALPSVHAAREIIVTTPSYPAVLDANGREIKVGDWLDWPSLDATFLRKVTSLDPFEYEMRDRDDPERSFGGPGIYAPEDLVVIPGPYAFTTEEPAEDYSEPDDISSGFLPEYPEEVSPKAGPVTLLALSDSPRADALLAAAECVLQDRAAEHGDAEDNFWNIAKLWQAYIDATPRDWRGFSPKDVAAMMALVKIARLATNPANKDNWVDLIGYAACGWEVASK